MNSIVSLISGQFTRSLILGAFFPVVLFLSLSVLTMEPLLKNLRLVSQFRSLSTQNDLVALTFVAITLTVFLYFLNTPIVRFLEGYPWIESAWGKRRKGHYDTMRETLQFALPRLRWLRSEWATIDPNHSKVAELQKEATALDTVLNIEFPHKTGLVLPTRFGNVLRSFEMYPMKQYGIDAIPFWPRIITVADKDTLAAVEDARSSVDLFVNSAVLSSLLAGMLFVVGCLEINRATPWQTAVLWPFEILSATCCAVLFYWGAIAKVRDWGAQVRSVFDLFRFDLLKKIGYQQTVEGREEERKLWQSITKQVMFGDPPSGNVLPYKVARPRTVLSCNPPVEAVSITGGVTREQDGPWKYTYRVSNKSVTNTTVSLSENLPDGWAYIWASAQKDGNALAVSGTNPYVFDLGSIPGSSDVELTFSTVLIEMEKVKE